MAVTADADRRWQLPMVAPRCSCVRVLRRFRGEAADCGCHSPLHQPRSSSQASKINLVTADDFWAAFLPGLAVAAVSVLAWLIVVPAVKSLLSRRSRRRDIVLTVRHAEQIAFQALRDGDYQRAWASNSTEPLRSARQKYDDFTTKALSMFAPSEDAVAMWTAIELYAGWHAPLSHLTQIDAPRVMPSAEGPPLIDLNDPQFALPRHSELIKWANTWRTGNINGPRYGDLHDPGDMYRHEMCPPNTDSVSDILREVRWDTGGEPKRISKRERKRLTKYYGWSQERAERELEERLQRQYLDAQEPGV